MGGKCGSMRCPDCWSEGSGGHGVSRMDAWGVFTLFGVVIVMGGVVLSGLLLNLVVVANGRLLGSGRVEGVGMSTAIVFCSGDMLLGKRVIVLLKSKQDMC